MSDTEMTAEPPHQWLSVLLAERDNRYEQRFLAQEKALENALSTHDKLMQEAKERISELLHERDLRYQQRFDAQERAVQVALDQANKEFHEHLKQVKEETNAALTAAEKAIAKAEQATDKDIASLMHRVDDLREQIVVIGAEVMGRAEFDRVFSALSGRIDQQVKNCDEKVSSLAATTDSRLTSLANQLAEIRAITQ